MMSQQVLSPSHILTPPPPLSLVHTVPPPPPLLSRLSLPRAALNERCLSEATKAFGDVHPVVARIIDQKGQMLLSEKDLEGAASWFAEARQVCTCARCRHEEAEQHAPNVPEVAPCHHGGGVGEERGSNPDLTRPPKKTHALRSGKEEQYPRALMHAPVLSYALWLLYHTCTSDAVHVARCSFE